MRFRDPKEYIDEISRELDPEDCPSVVRLLSDYASAVGYIEGSEMGLGYLKDECAFWKEVALGKMAMRPARLGAPGGEKP